MQYIDKYYKKITFLLPRVAQGKRVIWMMEKNRYDPSYYNNSGETIAQWFHIEKEPNTQLELIL